jgi:putative sterol carrier protein
VSDASSEPPAVDPRQFATLVAGYTDEQLAAGLRANRDLILGQIFDQMALHLDSDAAREVEAVLEWRIAGRADGGHDRYQVLISKGTCGVARDGNAAPTVTYTIQPVEFLRLVTGNASGPELFMTGRITVEGDLMLAAMTQSWFRVPGRQASTGA